MLATAPQEPVSIDPVALRRAFGTFLTGVTVITTRDSEGRPRGMTANSFTSVSLDPPLLLVCIANTAGTAPALREAAHFGVNVLQIGQQPTSNRFAAKGEDRFAGQPWAPGQTGVPLLGSSLVSFECQRESLHEAGDHFILVGRVVRGRLERSRPGFGFVVPEDGGRDVFVPARHLEDAMHGDVVTVRITGEDDRGPLEGAVVEVLDRRGRTVLGRFRETEGGAGAVDPFERGAPAAIPVPAGERGGAREGDAVVLEVRSVRATFASALAVFAVRAASALAAFVATGDVVLALPVALTLVVFGPFAAAPVVLGEDAFGPAFTGFGDDTFVVFGDDTFVVFAETCCGFGADALLPWPSTVVDEATTNATVETNAISVLVMNPPEGREPQSPVECKPCSSGRCALSAVAATVSPAW